MKTRKPKIRVLIADDHAVVRAGLATLLGTEGDIEVVAEAKNGKEAVAMAIEARPDVVIMDLRMPEMDGLAATEAIRALDRPDAKKIPIIAMTANAFDEDVQRSLQVGMNAHLSKPVEPERLYQTLEELIWEYDQAKNNKEQ